MFLHSGMSPDSWIWAKCGTTLCLQTPVGLRQEPLTPASQRVWEHQSQPWVKGVFQMKLWIWEMIHQVGLWLSAASPFQSGLWGFSLGTRRFVCRGFSYYLSDFPSDYGQIPVAPVSFQDLSWASICKRKETPTRNCSFQRWPISESFRERFTADTVRFWRVGSEKLGTVCRRWHGLMQNVSSMCFSFNPFFFFFGWKCTGPGATFTHPLVLAYGESWRTQSSSDKYV